jgi:hypothetical protein
VNLVVGFVSSVGIKGGSGAGLVDSQERENFEGE